MHVLAFGLNHTTAPIEVRERAAVTENHLEDAIKDLIDHCEVREAAILSTCNRTEIYCRQDSIDTAPLINWLCNYHEFPPSEVVPYLYTHPDEAAVQHAFRVAAGLDSMVLGEPQILGQMKSAFATAHRVGATGKILNRLFQHSFSVAKQIRTHTSVGNHAVSVAYAAVSLARQIFSDLSEQTVLLIGAGETIELTARHLADQNVRKIIIANRTLSRAEQLANQYASRSLSLDTITLDEIPHRLADADIVITSTASTLPILGKGAVEQALKARRHRPIFMVDLAVPRDIEAQVSELGDVYLYTVDDLEQVVTENLASRREAADDAEKIVDTHASKFMTWIDSLGAVPTIRSLRERVNQQAEDELIRARRRLQSGEPADEVLSQFARALTRKFTHVPSRKLAHVNDEELLEAARILFDLDGFDLDDVDRN